MIVVNLKSSVSRLKSISAIRTGILPTLLRKMNQKQEVLRHHPQLEELSVEQNKTVVKKVICKRMTWTLYWKRVWGSSFKTKNRKSYFINSHLFYQINVSSSSVLMHLKICTINNCKHVRYCQPIYNHGSN